jgi:hypothetical protein
MLDAMKTARRVTFCAYFLKPGPVERSLEDAARHGAEVHVRADGDLYGDCKAKMPASRAAIRALQRLHADAAFVHTSDDDAPGLHMKAAVCDGVAFLDDCNWSRGGDTVIRDDKPSHVRAICSAILERAAPPAGGLCLTKASALDAERRMLQHPRCRQVDVQTEDIGRGEVSKQLRELAARHVRCRVLVSERSFKSHRATHDAAVSLQKAGVDVRIAKASEKLAVAGERGWVGSANATTSNFNGADIDWSLTTNDARTVRALKRRFDARWRDAAAVA